MSDYCGREMVDYFEPETALTMCVRPVEHDGMHWVVPLPADELHRSAT